MNTVQIVPANEEHLREIAVLAQVIWHEYYPAIITREQIDYMLVQMYSLETLRAELQNGIYYSRLLIDGELSGFASFGPTEQADIFKLHKLYLHPKQQRRGLGTALLKQCENQARELGARRLLLNVNKRNRNAIKVYERNGFRVAESVVVDIGNGFVMDDYVMSKSLD